MVECDVVPLAEKRLTVLCADDPAWQGAMTIALESFRPEGSAHRPVTHASIAYDAESLHLLFRVEDQYVRSVQTDYMGPVCTDSCVEFFVRPREDRGYFNFEMNAGGTLHASYVEDWTRQKKGGLTVWEPVDAVLAETIQIRRSLPSVVEPEMETPVSWWLTVRIPFAVLERYLGALGTLAGQAWRANFYKCADKTSHPHWAAWSPVRELNFHQPDDFGMLHFSS